MLLFLQEISQDVESMKEDLITNSALIGLVLERVWSRVSEYLQTRDKKQDEHKLDSRMDKIAEDVAKIKGRLDKF